MLSADLPAAVGPTTAMTGPRLTPAPSWPRSRPRRRAPRGSDRSPRQSPPAARTAPASTCHGAPAGDPQLRRQRRVQAEQGVGVRVGQGRGDRLVVRRRARVVVPGRLLARGRPTRPRAPAAPTAGRGRSGYRRPTQPLGRLVVADGGHPARSRQPGRSAPGRAARRRRAGSAAAGRRLLPRSAPDPAGPYRPHAPGRERAAVRRRPRSAGLRCRRRPATTLSGPAVEQPGDGRVAGGPQVVQLGRGGAGQLGHDQGRMRADGGGDQGHALYRSRHRRCRPRADPVIVAR